MIVFCRLNEPMIVYPGSFSASGFCQEWAQTSLKLKMATTVLTTEKSACIKFPKTVLIM